jgi:beta-N-acetylhexosaminidase
MSAWFINDLLRGRIGFDGVVITEDIMMNGSATVAGSVSRAAKRSLAAGNDIVMMNSTPGMNDAIWKDLAAAMRNESDFRATVREAARRVLALKLKYLKGANAVPLIPDVEAARTGLPDPEGAAFFQGLASRSVTVVEDDKSILPLPPQKAGRVLLAGQDLNFFAAGRKAFPGVSSYWYNSPVSAELYNMARSCDTVIFCLSNDEGLAALRELRPTLESMGKNIIIFSALNPSYIQAVSWPGARLASIAVYSYSPESLAAGFSVIVGKIDAMGITPYTLAVQ